MYEVSFGANAGGRYITTVSMVSLKPLAAYGRPTALEGLASAPNNVFFFGPNLRFPAACGECIFRSWTCVSVLRVEGLSNELTACACQTFFVLCLVCSILTVVPVTYFLLPKHTVPTGAKELDASSCMNDSLMGES